MVFNKLPLLDALISSPYASLAPYISNLKVYSSLEAQNPFDPLYLLQESSLQPVGPFDGNYFMGVIGSLFPFQHYLRRGSE